MDRFDFVVVGIPRSRQARRRKVRDEWIESVRRAASGYHDGGRPPYTTEISAALIYFYRDETSIDVDNIGKPIFDALKGYLLEDDGLITQLVSRKTDQSTIAAIKNPTEVLAFALNTYDQFVYVVLGRPPDHEEIPL